MGVYIRVKKPIKFIMTEEDYKKSSLEEQRLVDYTEKVFPLYTLNFEPIKHLSQFQWGYWECETPTSISISVAYSTWGVSS